MTALLLDLDDTLVDERYAVQCAFSAFIRAHRHRFPSDTEEALLARWRKITLRHWVRCERGELSFQDQRRFRLRDFLDQPFTDEEADEAFAPYRLTYLETIRLFEEVPEFLERTANVPKILVTNGDRELQRQKLELLGLSWHMKAMITPMDCDSWKPDHRIFRAAAEQLGARLEDCIMIGDDDIRDIQPARALGMQTFRVDAQDPERTLLKALDYFKL